MTGPILAGLGGMESAHPPSPHATSVQICHTCGTTGGPHPQPAPCPGAWWLLVSPVPSGDTSACCSGPFSGPGRSNFGVLLGMLQVGR